ncbi:MAG TPA: VCBS repeat-containing protein [Acidimicrobiia bacterium]|jgi:hypothetical protein
MNRVGSGLVFVAALTLGFASMSRAGAAPNAPITPSPFNEAHVSVSAGYVPIVGDFDGDGHSDVFWYHPGPGADYVWWGTGNASTFGTAQDQFVVNGSYRPVAGDFNGDGRTDIAWIPVDFPAQSYVWLGNANRTFTSGQPLGSYGLPKLTYRARVFAGDFNGDGKDDLFVYSPGSHRVVLFGAASFTTMFTSDSFTPVVHGDYAPIAADFNGDGRTDIYWAQFAKGPCYVWVTKPNTTFTSSRIDCVPPTSFAGDFNGDGNADIFEYEAGSFAERILPGTASQIAPITFASTIVPNVVGTYTPVVGKFGSNAKSDIIWYSGTGAPSPFWIAR